MDKISKTDSSSKIAYIFEGSKKMQQEVLQSEFIEGIHPKIDWVIAHLNGLSAFPKAIRPWTVNTIEEMDYCFRNQFARFHTDFPELAVQLHKKRVVRG